jgi:hypothetical protein
MNRCRCGHEGEGEHPCHGDAYKCRKPSKQRFYNARHVALAGMQMKMEVSSTWACDECWKKFRDITTQTNEDTNDA